MFDDTLVEPVPRHRRLATAFAALSHFFVIGLVVAITSARPAALFINPPCSHLAITHVTFRPPSPPFPPGPSLDVRVLQSIALLDRAAIDAVRRWRYAPAVVNGRAVPVVLTVTVTFVL